MSNIYIYLAGPIIGCNNMEANDWREMLMINLGAIGMTGVSPLRCEPLIGKTYQPQYEDNKFGTPQVIAAKNKMDVARCDLTLAYQPALIPADSPQGRLLGPTFHSIGTQQEIGWAVGMGKPVILVTDDDHIRNNAVIKATVPWRFRDAKGEGFTNALAVIEGLFSVYSR